MYRTPKSLNDLCSLFVERLLGILSKSFIFILLIYIHVFSAAYGAGQHRSNKGSWQNRDHGYYNGYSAWQSRYYGRPYYAYYGYPLYGSRYYDSHPSYYTNYRYPSYPYNGYDYINGFSQYYHSYPSYRKYVGERNSYAPTIRYYHPRNNVGVFFSE